MATGRRSSDFRDFPGRRWLTVVLRAIHLVGVVGTGGALVAHLPVDASESFALLLVCSGVVMFAADTWSQRGYLRTQAGLAMLLKLLFVGWFFADAARRPALFWIILSYSAIVAHAPARWRHRRWR